MYDGVFVMCCQTADGSPFLIKPSQYGGNYDYAIGVAIFEKGYPLIISLNDSPLLQWSSGSVYGGGYMTWYRQSAMFDFSGQSNTSSQVTHAECSGNTYAPGYCHNYSKIDPNGHGIKAGSWWLPSLGEWLIILANQTKINYALSKIKGADLIGGGCYFTSTEVSNDNVWWGDITGTIYQYNTKTRIGYARPVSYYLW